MLVAGKCSMVGGTLNFMANVFVSVIASSRVKLYVCVYTNNDMDVISL